MADNTVLNSGAGGDTVASEDVAGVKYQRLKLVDPTAGSTTGIGTSANPLRIDPTGTTVQPISGTVTANAGTGTLAVSGPLTDTQLRATAVPISGTVTANAGTGTLAVSGPLTDTQLRATPVPISGTVTANAGTGTLAVSGTFWQATQPVSAASLPLPSGAATGTAQTTGNTSLSSIDGKVTACNTGAVVLAAGSAAIGTITDGGSAKTLKSASFSLTATGTVVAAVPTKRLKVYAVKLVVSAALTVNFRDGASTALEGAQSIAINGGYVESVNPPAFLMGTTAGNSLDLVITGIGTAAGRASYWDDDGT